MGESPDYFENNLSALRTIYPGAAQLLSSLPVSPSSVHSDEIENIFPAEDELEKRWSPDIELHVVDRFASTRLPFLLFDRINLTELSEYKNRRLLLLEDRPEIFKKSLELYDWRALIQSDFCLFVISQAGEKVFKRFLHKYPDISSAGFEIYAGDETSTEERRKSIQKNFVMYRQGIQQSINKLVAANKAKKRPPFPKTIRFFVPGHNYLQEACVRSFHNLGYGAERLQWKNPIYRFVRSTAWIHDYRNSQSDTVFLLNTTPRVFTGQNLFEKIPLYSISWFVDNPLRYAAHEDDYTGCNVIGVFDKTYIPYIQPHTTKPVIEVRTGYGISESEIKDEIPTSDIDIAFVGEFGMKGVLALEHGLNRISPQAVKVANELLHHYDITKPINLTHLAKEEFARINMEYKGSWVEFLENKATSVRRRYFLEALVNKVLVIFGDEEWCDPAFAKPLADCYAGKRLDYFDELPALYASAKINLNIFHIQCVNAPNPRVYDVLACGGFLLTEYNPGLEDEFEIGQDLAVFHSCAELIEKTDYYLSHPEERKQIAECGRKKVLAKCGYSDRMQIFLSALAK